MSRINEKMGLKPAGKRAFMKLPKNRATAARITSAACPACGQRGARQSVKGADWLFCSWCSHSWELPAVPA